MKVKDTKKSELWKNIVQFFLIILGISFTGLGLKGFLLPAGFIDGGVVGISMLVAQLTHINLAILIPIINLPFIYLAIRYLGKSFAIKSLLSILGLSLALVLIPYPIVTNDKLLSAVFGGFFVGAGIGLTLRGGAVQDGTEIAALILDRLTHMLNMGNLILLMNILIFGSALFILGVEPALYSILTYFAASKTMNFILYGLEEYTGITIISEKNDEIRIGLLENFNCGVTIYKGMGGKMLTEQLIIYCVITRLEIGRVKSFIKDLDPKAFITIESLSDVDGGIVRKKDMH
ncbi:MAG: YitT family protein [Bacteroidota bacterium]|nr:YitT family protein [Bacteroidota bacterium]